MVELAKFVRKTQGMVFGFLWEDGGYRYDPGYW